MFLQKKAISFQKRPSHQLRRKSALIGCFLCLAFGLTGLPRTVWSQFFPQPTHFQQARPNIILILTDDQDASTLDAMPRLKRDLMDKGTTFISFFTASPLCCPSRTSILRGQYVHNHNVLTNKKPEGGFEKFQELGLENETIPKWLQSFGYRTVLLGKYLNGYPHTVSSNYIPSGWDEWYVPTNGSPYSCFNYELNENGKLKSYGNGQEDYLTDVLSKNATSFIQRQKSTDTPFCMFLWVVAPHLPSVPAPRHQGLFSNAKVPRVPSFNEADVSDKPDYIQQLPKISAKTIKKMDDIYQKRLQSLQAVDEMVEALVETLRKTGQLENTYIFFTSDNGYHIGQHRIPTEKGTPYEEAIRFPLIVRGPGVAEGQTLPYLTSNIDLAPTFIELAGAVPPDFVDGKSLVQLLKSPLDDDENWQNLLIEFWPPKGDQDKHSPKENSGVMEPDDVMPALKTSEVTQVRAPQWAAIRTARYLYVEYVTGERELYDLQVDPYELQNIYTAAQPSLLRSLEANLNALRSCVGRGCREAQRLRL